MRRQKRTEISTPVQVMWKDRYGNDKFANAQSIDVCETGIRLQMPEVIADRSYVTLRADKLGLHGAANVRSCHKKGTRYVVGMEFSGGLTWKPAKAKQPAVVSADVEQSS